MRFVGVTIFNMIIYLYANVFTSSHTKNKDYNIGRPAKTLPSYPVKKPGLDQVVVVSPDQTKCLP